MRNRYFVVDTNLLISALLTPFSNSRKALDKANEIGFLVFSDQTFLEISNVLFRSKFDRYVSVEDRIAYLANLQKEGIIINTSSHFNECRDPKDNIFLELAYDGEASHIITGDIDLLVLNPFKDIEIIRPADFLLI